MSLRARDSDDVIDIWNPIFKALSVSQFGLIWQALGYPAPLEETIRPLCQKYVVSIYSYFEPEFTYPPPFQRLTFSDHEDLPLKLCNSVFEGVETALGSDYARRFYNWGRQTYDNFRLCDNQVAFYGPWEEVLVVWSEMPERLLSLPLRLDEEKKSKIREIVVNVWYEMRATLDRIHEFPDMATDDWDLFALTKLRADAWMAIQTRFYAAVSRWEKILAMLSDEEIDILQHWGWAQLERLGLKWRTPIVRNPLDDCFEQLASSENSE